MLENFRTITLDTPVDIIIRQIRSLITSGQLKPGDRLPSERLLADRFQLGRSYVRDAIRKLEFYGILKTVPQSGTVVAGLGIIALEGLIADVLKIEETDFPALIETRVLLEKQAAYFAAQRRTRDDIVAMQSALYDYRIKLATGLPAVEEDLLFHLKIAEASKNAVLKSLMLVMTADVINSFISHNVCKDEYAKPLAEHEYILECIIDQDADGALKAMDGHLSNVLDYSQSV